MWGINRTVLYGSIPPSLFQSNRCVIYGLDVSLHRKTCRIKKPSLSNSPIYWKFSYWFWYYFLKLFHALGIFFFSGRVCMIFFSPWKHVLLFGWVIIHARVCRIFILQNHPPLPLNKSNGAPLTSNDERAIIPIWDQTETTDHNIQLNYIEILERNVNRY